MLLNLEKAHILVTGGAGFMGSAFIRYILKQESFKGHVTNLDLLTYAGNLASVASVSADKRYTFCLGDIRNYSLLVDIHSERKIDLIVHFAAETHVDRSIDHPQTFLETNIMGTYSLLQLARGKQIHFHHISTDEVYGALGEEGHFTEESPYRPNSPYAASKASSDHLVRAFAKTYGVSTTLSHASNNYGPFQYPEKFIPLMIQNALEGKPLPVYGKGDNVREWLFVEDHARAIWTILSCGERGEVYNIGGGNERSNLDLLHLILKEVEEVTGEKNLERLITFVSDRPGHDFRYAMSGAKVEKLGYLPMWSLEKGIRETVQSFPGVCV
ncbi:MAG: dTDP-glucose 4,6-dehydratase [Chlamydiia bacterium]|nr:dTDP-glucose 4,6-dehydratase [Chlamydiia bacterium]